VAEDLNEQTTPVFNRVWMQKLILLQLEIMVVLERVVQMEAVEQEAPHLIKAAQELVLVVTETPVKELQQHIILLLNPFLMVVQVQRALFQVITLFHLGALVAEVPVAGEVLVVVEVTLVVAEEQMIPQLVLEVAEQIIPSVQTRAPSLYKLAKVMSQS
jgi:hypothetical protein